MTTNRVICTVFCSLSKSIRSISRLGQQNVVKLHLASQKHVFVSPTTSFFLSQKRNLSMAKENQAAEDRKTVYNGSLTTQIRSVKWFSLSTSFAGLIAQPILYKELSTLENLPLLIAGCSFVGLFTFVTPFLLHFVTKKYVTKLDFCSKTDTYIATTTNFFGLQKELQFKPDDVHVPDISGMFTTFHAKGKALFLEARLFEDPSHYARIMGYDKPMDFKLYQTVENSTKMDSLEKK